jgi:hypothetical protein
MFHWYRKVERCYVYLTVILAIAPEIRDRNYWEIITQGFRNSRWFTRGWTLQELLALESVEFFSAQDERLGDKTSFRNKISVITGIPPEALQGASFYHYSVKTRLSWMRNRTTKHKEDEAYSMLSIFGVYLQLIYGEERDNALRSRLLYALEFGMTKLRLQHKLNRSGCSDGRYRQQTWFWAKQTTLLASSIFIRIENTRM